MTVVYALGVVPTEARSSDGTLDVFGADVSTGKGVIVSSSSGWVEVVAATPRSYRNVMLIPSINGVNNPSQNTYIRGGKGAPGSEVELGRMWSRYSNTESIWTDGTVAPEGYSQFLPGVPAGTRLAVATTSGFSMGACLIGVP